MRQLSWVVVAVVNALLPFGASAAPGWMSARAAEDGLVWAPHPVSGPRSPAEVTSIARLQEEAKPRSALEVGPERGAVLWLEALQVVRVTADAPELRFVRIPASDAAAESRLEIDEPGIPVREGSWFLAEPMGEGSAWIVLAPKKTRVHVEHPRYGRNAQDEEAVRLSILRWIDGQGPLPLLPFHPELRGRLEADAEAALLLEAQAGEDLWLRAAATAWRKASAMQAWMLTHALDGTMFRIASLSPPGERLSIEGYSPDYTRFAAPQDAWTFEVEGPGVLVVEGRALLRHAREEDRTLEVLESGRVLAEETLAGRASLDVPLKAGQRVGFEGEVRIPLGRGKRTLTLRTSGPSLVRLRKAERRPWLADVLRGQVEWSDWSADAVEALQGADTAAAVALRQLVASLDGTGLALGEGEERRLGALPPIVRALVLARAAELATDLSRRAELATSAADALEAAGRPGTPLAWEVAVTASRVLAETGRGVQARRLLASMEALPDSGWALAQAAEVIRSLPLGAPVRSRELAALELAWRKEPLSQEIRRRYRRAFWRHSRWSLTHPLGSDGLPPPSPAEFVDLAASAPGPGAHWLLRPDDPAQIAVTAPPGGAARLRAIVLPAPGAKGPLALHVDGVRIPVRPVGEIERLELALDDGLHDLRLEAPLGTRAFVSHRPRAAAPEPEEIAYVRRAWPVRSRGEPVHFRIPEANLPNPIRLHLRAGTARRAPVTLWLRTDVGPARRLVLRPQRSAALHFRLEREGAHTAPAEAVLTLPALTRQIWIDAEEDVPVFAAVSVRSGLAQDVKVQPPGTLDSKVLENLLTLSRRLRTSPQDAELRLERAALLQALGEEELARDDVGPLFDVRGALTEVQVRRLAEVVAWLDDPEGGTLRLRRPPASRVEVLLPAYAVLAATSSEHSEEARQYLEARRRAFRGEHADAALELVKLYRDQRAPQLALEALGQLEQLQGDAERWPGFAAPLGSALTDELGTWADLPRISRMRGLTARWARWESLRGAEESAGVARAVTTAPELELNGDAVRMAYLAPPWPLADTRLLRSGYASVLDLHLDRPARLGADATCGSVSATWRTGGCALALRVDGRTVARAQVGAGEVARLRTGELEPGPHQIEVTLANDNPLAVAVARFASEHGEYARTVMPGQPLSMLRALPEKPVVVVVQGPAALRVGARAAVPGEAQRVLLETTGPDGAKRAGREIALPIAPDPAVQGAGLGSESQFVVLLPEPGVHRVRVDTQGGEALLRVRLATARDGRRPADAWEGRSAALEPLQWPALSPPLALLPTGVTLGDGGWSLGMVSARLLAEHEDLDENDEVEDQPLQLGAVAGLALRRELAEGRAWGRVEAVVRMPTSLAPAYGLRAGLHAKGLPLDLRAQLYAAGYMQALEDGQGWRVFGRARFDRWIPLTSDLSLIPAVALSLQRQSDGGVADPDAFVRSVFSRYGEDHPLRLQPMASLRWAPVLDHVAWLRAGAVSNADLASLDNVGGELGWASLLGRTGMRTHAAYAASWRFRDAHRREGWLRHELIAGADWAAWSTANGRLLLFGEGRALLSTRFGLESLASVGVRWDFSGGRGLRDVSPYEEEFEALHSPRRSSR